MFWRNAPAKAASPRAARYWSLARRLTWLYTGATALLLILACAYLYWTQVANLAREDNAFLVNKIRDCRRLLRRGAAGRAPLVNEVRTEARTSPIKYYLRILGSQERRILATPGMDRLLPPRVFPIAAATAGPRGVHFRVSAHHVFLLSAGQAMGPAPARRRRVVQVALDISRETALTADYRRDLLLVVLLGTSFSWLVGAWIARRGLKPLRDMTAATERITARQLHERMRPDGWPAELASLARSFDRMLDRLEDSFRRLAQFSADLAHELRTPINNLRGEAGVALSQLRSAEEYRRTLESSLEEYARLARLIDNLLFLARTDDPTAVGTRTPCDARRAAETVREFYAAVAEDRAIRVRCDGQGTVHADPVLLRQAISNLLSNALNYTSAGGSVTIQVQPRTDRGLEVIVSDTGSGIAPEHLPHIFDRLYRADPARSRHPDGAGLGLAIVQSIMIRHGGSVAVHSAPGQGATFTLSFPPEPDSTFVS